MKILSLVLGLVSLASASAQAHEYWCVATGETVKLHFPQWLESTLAAGDVSILLPTTTHGGLAFEGAKQGYGIEVYIEDNEDELVNARITDGVEFTAHSEGVAHRVTLLIKDGRGMPVYLSSPIGVDVRKSREDCN